MSLETITFVASIISLVTAAGALTSSTSLIFNKANGSTRTLERIAGEMETLSQVLTDVQEVLALAKFSIPCDDPRNTIRMRALEHACGETKDRFYRMALMLERFLRQRSMETATSRLRLAFWFATKEDSLMLHYQSLRDSASLARDLASDLKVELLLARVDERLRDQLGDVDYRVNHQLLQLTASMATLLADEDDEPEDGKAQQVPITRHTQEEPRSQEDSLKDKKERGGFRKMARIGRQMVELSETGFTRSITLIIDTIDAGQNNDQSSVSRYIQKEVKILSKLDTASDANLVSYDMLVQEGLREDLLVPIPVDKRVELHGLDGAKCTPEWEMTLHWYKVKDMKRRQDKFLVVKEAPFEVLFSSDSSFRQLSDRSVLVSKQRQKSKEEVLAEIKAEEDKRKEALERVEEEYHKAEAKNRVPIRKNTGLMSP